MREFKLWEEEMWLGAGKCGRKQTLKVSGRGLKRNRWGRIKGRWVW